MRDKNSKRLFNIRPVCFFTLFLSAGIILGEALSSYNPLFRFIPVCALVASAVLFFVFSKTRKLSYIPIACLVGFIAICGSNDVYSSKYIDDYSGEFRADVASEIIVEDGAASFYVNNIYVGNKRLNSKAWVSVPYEFTPDFGVGDTVSLDGSIFYNKHVAFDIGYPYRVSKNNAYTAIVGDVRKIADKEPPFLLKVQISIKRLFYENMDADSASICQALFLGDKAGMDDNLYGDVAASGLAHVLAVSGLHISFLSAAIYFLLRKLKLNAKLDFALVTALTFVYVMLCGFTPSALRAFIMSTVFTFASTFGKKRDNLSCLAAAAGIILLFSPTSIMHSGFLLSAFSVLGIFVLYAPFEKTGMKAVERISPKRHLGKSIVQSSSVAVSVTLMTYPLTAFFFGKVSTFFLISSVIVLPYVMLVYALLLAVTVFALVTTLGGAVGIMEYLLMPFKAYVKAVGNLSFSQIPTAAGVIGIIAFTLCILILSRFIFLRRDTKLKTALCIVPVSMVLGLLAAV